MNFATFLFTLWTPFDYRRFDGGNPSRFFLLALRMRGRTFLFDLVRGGFKLGIPSSLAMR